MLDHRFSFGSFPHGINKKKRCSRVNVNKTNTGRSVTLIHKIPWYYYLQCGRKKVIFCHKGTLLSGLFSVMYAITINFYLGIFVCSLCDVNIDQKRKSERRRIYRTQYSSTITIIKRFCKNGVTRKIFYHVKMEMVISRYVFSYRCEDI